MAVSDISSKLKRGVLVVLLEIQIVLVSYAPWHPYLQHSWDKAYDALWHPYLISDCKIEPFCYGFKISQIESIWVQCLPSRVTCPDGLPKSYRRSPKLISSYFPAQDNL